MFLRYQQCFFLLLSSSWRNYERSFNQSALFFVSTRKFWTKFAHVCSWFLFSLKTIVSAKMYLFVPKFIHFPNLGWLVWARPMLVIKIKNTCILWANFSPKIFLKDPVQTTNSLSTLKILFWDTLETGSIMDIYDHLSIHYWQQRKHPIYTSHCQFFYSANHSHCFHLTYYTFKTSFILKIFKPNPNFRPAINSFS